MSPSLTIPLGVVVTRQRIADPWQEYRWRPVSVFLDPPEVADWRAIPGEGEAIHYHAATLPLELHHKETAAYRVNLAGGEPAVYVVLRDDPGASDQPVSIPVVSASPYEVQAYGESGVESVDRVPMPEPLIALVQDFIAAHHVEAAPFVKRQRQKHYVEAQHTFGQEPIFVLRDRMRKKTNGSGSDE